MPLVSTVGEGTSPANSNSRKPDLPSRDCPTIPRKAQELENRQERRRLIVYKIHLIPIEMCMECEEGACGLAFATRMLFVL